MSLSDYYPDWMPLSGICQCEGCDYGSGGICWRCGSRLRCLCGQFVRVDTFDAHFTDHPHNNTQGEHG